MPIFFNSSFNNDDDNNQSINISINISPQNIEIFIDNNERSISDNKNSKEMIGKKRKRERKFDLDNIIIKFHI